MLNGTPAFSSFIHWRQLKKVTAVNNAVDYCSPTADICSGFTENWPTAEYTYATTSTDVSQPLTVKDAEARVTTYTYNASGKLSTIKRAGAASPDVTYNHQSGATGKVTSVDLGFGTWSYSFSGNSGNRTATVTDPASSASSLVSDIATGRVESITDELGRTVSYQYDSDNRVTRITQPEGDRVDYVYDSRGNITQTTATPKSGSGLATIVTSATYASSCSNAKTCNQPTNTTDARGKVTNYTYDANHGGVLTVTAPAPGGGAARPETRFTYAQKQSRYKTGSSSYANGSIWVLTETSACATQSSCDGGADETVSTLAYPSSSTPNNLLPVSVTSAAGNGSLSAVTLMTYTPQGDVETVDGPLPGGRR